MFNILEVLKLGGELKPKQHCPSIQKNLPLSSHLLFFKFYKFPLAM